MTLTVTITCNGITRTAKGTAKEVNELVVWMKNLVLPQVVVKCEGYPASVQTKYGKDL